jgi:hypothetical protein
MRPALILVIALASPLEAQRLRPHPDSVTRLTTTLSPQSQAAVDAYLTRTDSAARAALGPLRTDPGALHFLIYALPHEPSPQLRRAIIAIVQNGDYIAPAHVRAALQARVRDDNDTTVVAAAIDALRATALRQTDLPALLASRIARARASRDTPILQLALEADEAFVHLERLVHARAFLRTPPPIFSVPAANQSVRVLAFGDYGTAHLPNFPSHQRAVAQVIGQYHRLHKFTFGITTGDNFYPTSFASPTDSAWKKSWDDLYTPLGIPFYISLGNHDWGEPAGPLAQHIYGLTSASWKLPAFYYSYVAGPAQFFALNTNALTEKLLSWLRSELARSTAPWKIVYGHHPVFEQTDYAVERQRQLLLPILRQYGVDMYLAGHHHSLQHWQVEGLDYVVTGAGGARNYGLGDTVTADARRRFVASRPGFADLEITDSTLSLTFVGVGDRSAAPVVLHRYTRRKR